MSKPATFGDVARATINSNLFNADGTRGKVLEADDYCDCDVCIFNAHTCRLFDNKREYGREVPCRGIVRDDGKDVVVVRY